jgi:hypothetical protein
MCLVKYLCKFHSFLKVKNKMLQIWHYCSSQILYLTLYAATVFKALLALAFWNCSNK